MDWMDVNLSKLGDSEGPEAWYAAFNGVTYRLATKHEHTHRSSCDKNDLSRVNMEREMFGAFSYNPHLGLRVSDF